MPNHSAIAIANEFAERQISAIPQMKLQKLCYIAHGWNMAINRTPLIADRIEAWDGGPVMRVLWNHIRDRGYDLNNRFFSHPLTNEPWRAVLEPSENNVIKHVWLKYGQYSGLQLSEMTHRPGTPWSNAYFGRGRNAQIDNGDIQQHFIELALAGRAPE